MNKIDPFVKLIGKMDYRDNAWRTSRPGTETDFVEVIKMDFSLNSMAVYHFEIRSSGFFRDLMLAIRPIAPWAMGVRSMPKVDSSNIAISGEYTDNLGWQGVDNFFDRLALGETRDNSRECLPLSVSSFFSIVIDYRALISFCKNIMAMNNRLYCEYCIPMLAEAKISADEFKNSKIKESLEYYQISENEMIHDIQQTGNMIHGHYQMKMAMASQFLRQHNSKVKIGLWNLITDYYEADIRQTDIIDVVFYTDVHSYRKLMSMRSHWMLDWNMDMWGSLIADYTQEMTTEEFWFFIPSGNNQEDPYMADQLNRIALDDPGLPCPILLQDRSLIDERRKELGDNPILNKYEALFDEGFVRDNEDNQYRLNYYNNLGAKACPN